MAGADQPLLPAGRCQSVASPPDARRGVHAVLSWRARTRALQVPTPCARSSSVPLPAGTPPGHPALSAASPHILQPRALPAGSPQVTPPALPAGPFSTAAPPRLPGGAGWLRESDVVVCYVGRPGEVACGNAWWYSSLFSLVYFTGSSRHNPSSIGFGI